MNWAYGVTTCLGRINDLLPRTLESLRSGGFDNPAVFADDVDAYGAARLTDKTGLRVVPRGPALGLFGNWALAAWDLHVRNPTADYYAIFQDDLVMSRNVRQYIERTPYPPNSYLNLYTFPCNYDIAPRDNTGQVGRGWFRARNLKPVEGNPRNFQLGKGAVALVFSRDAFLVLLSAYSFVAKPRAANPRIRTKRIDGGIVEAMNNAGWSEYCHHPSLVQHTGSISSHRNEPQPQSINFYGEQYDALQMLEEQV